MNLLEYKIAWIDNQRASAEGYTGRISTLLGRYGFGLVVDWITNSEELDVFLERLSKQDEYDMILVDWNLGQMVPDKSGGASVAHSIRAQHSSATIIFYSAAEPRTLRSEIAGKLIDGVFCVNRMHFFEEASPLIKASVRKFSDINAMRGLFLSAVSEFDDLIREAVLRAFFLLPAPYQQQVVNQLLDGRISYTTKQAKDAAAYPRPAELPKVLKAIQPSSWELYQSLVAILGLAAPSPTYTQAVNKFKQYGEEVLIPRNDMAHLREQEKNGVKILVRGGRQWDAAKFDGLRHVLADHHDNLQYIKNQLVGELIAAIKPS